MKIALVTGGFDPLHKGHLDYFNAAKKLGDILMVGVNSDNWLTRKKGKPFLRFEDRVEIINQLKMVDCVFGFDDSDGTAVNAINFVRAKFPWAKIVFANGGDRVRGCVPEENLSDVEFVYGVGGTEKINSSSLLLEEWKAPKTIRPWGWYRVIDDCPGYKVKELIVEPNQKLSMQRHSQRSEHWHILKGSCLVKTEYLGISESITLLPGMSYDVGVGVWHQAINATETPCHILEVQRGTVCDETDIERK